MARACGVTPENISSLQPGQIFVFGSNLAGVHGAGAALLAMKWGARARVGYGLCGQTYALPTKCREIKTLSLGEIAVHVDSLFRFARNVPNRHFLITKVGCGLAGYTVEDIAPLFGSRFIELANVSIPREFIDICNVKQKEEHNVIA